MTLAHDEKCERDIVFQGPVCHCAERALAKSIESHNLVFGDWLREKTRLETALAQAQEEIARLKGPCAGDHEALTRVWNALPNPRIDSVWEQVAEIVAERDTLRAQVARLVGALGILIRACAAGAYTGKSSDAVTQAQKILADIAKEQKG